jgi:hypothetical protein
LVPRQKLSAAVWPAQLLLFCHNLWFNQLGPMLSSRADCFFVILLSPDPNYHQLPGGLVGGPDDFDQWVDDRDQFNPAVTVSILNNAGFSAALAGLVRYDINMAKCQQGNGFIQVRSISNCRSGGEGGGGVSLLNNAGFLLLLSQIALAG